MTDQAGAPEQCANELEARFALLMREARRRSDDCEWGARRYRYSYLRWDRRAQLLLLGAAVASFLASAALLTNLSKDHRDLAVILGVLSLLAGLLQVLYSVTDARKRADDYAEGERLFDRMQSRYERFYTTWSEPQTASDKLNQLMEEQEALQLPRPMERWTLETVRRELADKGNEAPKSRTGRAMDS
jgi:hypothetical protein